MSDSHYSGTYTVVGPPGCGKTTFLARQAEAVLARSQTAFGSLESTPVLVCSLTRTAAGEVVRKMKDMRVPLDSKCIGTLHSHAYRSLGCPEVVDGPLLKQWNDDQPQYAIGAGTPDPDEPEWEDDTKGPGDDTRNAYELLRARRTDRGLYPPHVEVFARRWEDFKKQTGAIDFSDMIEIALRDVASAPGEPSVILADEAQDLSRLEFALLHKWADQADALIVVGDAYQALYVWRGAAPQMLMPEDTSEERYRVLSQSYRVPLAVHRAATDWIKRLSTYKPIEYVPRKATGPGGDYLVPGEVRRCVANYAEPSRMIEEAAQLVDDGKTVMICASCSYVLQPTITALRAAGLPFANPWRVKRGDWNPLGGGRGVSMSQRLQMFLRADSMSYPEETPRLWTWEELYQWTAALKAEKLLARGAKKAITERRGETPDRIVDWTEVFEMFEPDALHELMGWLGDRETKKPPPGYEPIAKWYASHVSGTKEKASRYPLAMLTKRGLDAMSEPPRLYVGTIHSFKGAEADVVYVMPDLSPAGWREWGDETKGGRDSVIRLFYVAMTRARESLVFCEPGGPRSVEL